MPSREKDQADFDLETFVDLFDTAISSDNPAVQRALKNLLMIAAIVNADDAEAGMRQGPLRRVLEDQRNIIRRLERLETANDRMNQHPGFDPSPPNTGPVPLGPYFPGNPITSPNTATPWPGPGTTGPFGPFPPGTIWATTSSNTTNISSTAHEDQFKSYDNLYEKLESKSI
jgi:hypothetical protein